MSTSKPLYDKHEQAAHVVTCECVSAKMTETQELRNIIVSVWHASPHAIVCGWFPYTSSPAVQIQQFVEFVTSYKFVLLFCMLPIVVHKTVYE